MALDQERFIWSPLTGVATKLLALKTGGLEYVKKLDSLLKEIDAELVIAYPAK